VSANLSHPYRAAASFDGGDLDCGNGLLLLIRKHIDPLEPGQLLEIQSSEPTVKGDLPAWCRLTGNQLVSQIELADRVSFLVAKGRFAAPELAAKAVVESAARGTRPAPITQPIKDVVIPASLPAPAAAPRIGPLSVMGIGSWPRPRWLVRSLHEQLAGQLPEAEFQAAADDAVRLVVDAQIRAGVDVLTDGEQRRDDYASFVGGILDNCQLIPITDLLPYMEDPDRFRRELSSLDVPAEKVRHPAVFGKLGRSRPLAVHELTFLRSISDAPVKIALPGPYLLTRTMWMECISDRAYDTREQLADDIVRVLREELHFLLAAGASIVQFDEPVLTEVIYGRTGSGGRSFMCGALGAKGPVERELSFAQSLINQVIEGLPPERVALHICRGNWTPDESAALTGDYQPLLTLLSNLRVGTLFLELCTPRAGELQVLKSLPERLRIGVGVVNQKSADVETVEEIVDRAEKAIQSFGADRVLLNPDCGFATFADNPITAATVAEKKLAALSEAAATLRKKYGV
jgi:5-methyltetrahydropteroyltriglutamate--homocysteine methyltransferase